MTHPTASASTSWQLLAATTPRAKRHVASLAGLAGATVAGIGDGQGYVITEAYYQTTPGAGITVGAVPVPEPSSMMLLALGAGGVLAWRARRSVKGEHEA